VTGDASHLERRYTVCAGGACRLNNHDDATLTLQRWRRRLAEERAAREAAAVPDEAAWSTQVRTSIAVRDSLPLLHGARALEKLLREAELRPRSQPTEHSLAFGWPQAIYLSFGHAWPDRDAYLFLRDAGPTATATPCDTGLIWSLMSDKPGCVTWVHDHTLVAPLWRQIFPEWLSTRFDDPREYPAGAPRWPDPTFPNSPTRLLSAFEVQVNAPQLPLRGHLDIVFLPADLPRSKRRNILEAIQTLGAAWMDVDDAAIALKVNEYLSALARNAARRTS
jgi:hypothetical protein